MRSGKTGGLAYFYSKDQASDPAAKAFQNETLRDPLVLRFGRQLVAWKLERAEAATAFEAEKLQATPAVVVYDAGGKAVKAFQGARIHPTALAAALRSVAPDKTVPK